MTLFLPGEFDPDRIAGALGSLKLCRYQAGDSGAFAMLDCFDQSLRKAGLFLAEFGGELILFSNNGPQRRQPSERDSNFPADFRDGPVRDALGIVPPLRSLVTAATGTARECRFALTDSENKTHARLDVIVLDPAGDGETASVVSVRGLRGYGKSLKRLLDAMANPDSNEHLSVPALHKRLFPGLPAYDVKPVIRFSESETAYQAANDIITTYLGVARQNEPGIIADLDTEFLHDYRIALRKIRSVLSLFKGVYSDAQTEQLKGGFSALMAATGRLRDLDVYLLERQHYFDLLPETLHGGLEVMFGIFAQEREDQFRALRRRLKSAAYDTGISGLATQFSGTELPEPGARADRPANAYARELIWKRYRRVCRIAAGIDQTSPDSEVHELRIQCKKLRYLMEFFAPLFHQKEFKPLLKPLKRLQDNLGYFNDYSVQQISLQTFLESHSDGNRQQVVELAQSVGALIAVLHQRQVEERARVMSNFRKFDAPENKAAFRHLFKT